MRELWVISGLVVRLLAAAYDFPSLRQVAFVRRTFWKGAERVSEGRIFLTSIPRNRLSARRLLKSITDHWQVENSLHNLKDKHLNEDRQYTARVSLGCAQSSLRNLSLNALRMLTIPGIAGFKSLSSKALQLLANPVQALKRLGFV